ncbi:MAG: tRNA (adenosine(37)-N6)-threonylcarbamoyltransferase complex ATPase subunit type 1 TsaE [Chloroflexi bacterium]|nr:tRNA (adenosine(37)-N6)-threonylcarbamoyltransferase complex ATPase subunit type 1 TsaE [Chloroflexota bacterium]
MAQGNPFPFPLMPSQAQGLMVESHSESDTVTIGRAIGEALRRGDVVLLMGELGAGKTRMVRGMAVGIESPVPARSPTFVLVNEYRGRIRLSHCDLYRVAGPDEVEELALDERLVDGALVIEWPERAEGNFPEDALLVEIEFGQEDNDRTILLTPGGDSAAHLAMRAAAIYESLTSMRAPQPDEQAEAQP